MWTFLAGMGGKVAAIGAAALAALGAVLAIRQSGVKAEQATAAKKEVRNDEVANTARSDVDSASDERVASELHEWERR